MKKWETRQGNHFLQKAGIRQDQTVIDFGCGIGHYSIPLAALVGPHGMVYAIDKDRSVLSKLKRKAESRDLANLKTIRNSQDVTLEFEDKSIDAVLLYDMLHYLPGGKRKTLYTGIRRVLTDAGFLSVYPKHLAGDCPADHFKTMNIQNVIREIERAGFSLETTMDGTMSHDHSLVQGRVLTFRKT